jgi:hypothetical protein
VLHPHLKAVIVVPKWRTKPWFKQLRNFRLVDELAATEHVFACPTNDGIDGRRQDVGPTRWTTQIYVDDTDRARFLPKNPQNPRKTYWTHSMTLVTDSRRVLPTKEDIGTVWFPGRKHEIKDVTHKRTAAPTLTETTRFKLSKTNLHLLGTESSGKNKRYVCIARVLPGSIPNATSTSRTIWATWKELISEGRTGYLVRGEHQFPLCYKTSRKPIDGLLKKNIQLEDSVLATLHVSTTHFGTSLLVLEGTLRRHRSRILVDSGASENFCKADEWVREHHIPTVSREKYRIKLADVSTTTTRQRLRNELLTVGTLDIQGLSPSSSLRARHT